MRFLTAVALAVVIAVGCDPYAGQIETDVVIDVVTTALEGHRDNPYFPPDYGAHWLTQGGPSGDVGSWIRRQLRELSDHSRRYGGGQ